MSHPLDFRDGTLRCEWCGVLYDEADARPGGLLSEKGLTNLVICPRCHSRWRRRRQFRHVAFAAMAIAFPLALLVLAAVMLSR